MSREGIVLQLSAHSVEVSELVYTQEKISVYRGTYQGYAAAIKVQYIPPGISAGQLESEFRTIRDLAHPNILRLYDCFWTNNDTQYFLVFVSEWCAKDLAKDILQRVQNRYPWVEDELWVVVRKLIAVFAYMQQAGVAHCDIKPANVFLMADKDPRVGDFGSAVKVTGFATAVVGTPRYLSPKLREAFDNHIGKVQHNAFKSDVYSLGITFLEIASLDTKTALTSTDVIEEMINKLRYSEGFKGMVRCMLQGDEDQRPDFLSLQQWVSPAEIVLTVPSEPALKCIKCKKAVASDSQDAQRLFCDPQKHLFCSVNCFVVWAFNQTKATAKCPICNKEVDAELFRSHSVSIPSETSEGPPEKEAVANTATAPHDTEAPLIREREPEARTAPLTKAGTSHQQQPTPSTKADKSSQQQTTRRNQNGSWRRLCACCFTSE